MATNITNRHDADAIDETDPKLAVQPEAVMNDAERAPFEFEVEDAPALDKRRKRTVTVSATSAEYKYAEAIVDAFHKRNPEAIRARLEWASALAKDGGHFATIERLTVRLKNVEIRPIPVRKDWQGTTLSDAPIVGNDGRKRSNVTRLMATLKQVLADRHEPDSGLGGLRVTWYAHDAVRPDGTAHPWAGLLIVTMIQRTRS